jgi:hypothetical protein
MSEPAGPKLVYSRERPFVREQFEDIEPRSVDYLIKGILPRQGVGYIAGASKAGKTFVAIDWSCKLACGATVMKRKAKHVGVVYLAAEDPEGCRARIMAWRRKNPRQSYTPLELICSKINLLDDASVTQFIRELQDAAATFEENGFRLGLVVLDTLAKCVPGAEENGSVDGSLVLVGLRRIEEELDCFVLPLAHHGKAGAQSGIRGWSGFDADSDATITVERNEDDPTSRTITLSKVKNGADGARVAFELVRQDLGLTDEDGDEVWSCVVSYDSVEPDKVTKRRNKALSSDAQLILTTLGRLIDKGHGQTPPPTVEGVRPGTMAISRALLSLEAQVAGLRYAPDEKANTVNVRFGRRVIELLGAQRIRQEGDLLWPI